MSQACGPSRPFRSASVGVAGSRDRGADVLGAARRRCHEVGQRDLLGRADPPRVLLRRINDDGSQVETVTAVEVFPRERPAR
jgi:hypothetical protein